MYLHGHISERRQQRSLVVQRLITVLEDGFRFIAGVQVVLNTCFVFVLLSLVVSPETSSRFVPGKMFCAGLSCPGCGSSNIVDDDLYSQAQLVCADCGSVVSEGALANDPVGGSGMNSLSRCYTVFGDSSDSVTCPDILTPIISLLVPQPNQH